MYQSRHNPYVNHSIALPATVGRGPRRALLHSVQSHQTTGSGAAAQATLPVSRRDSQKLAEEGGGMHGMGSWSGVAINTHLVRCTVCYTSRFCGAAAGSDSNEILPNTLMLPDGDGS